MEETKVIAYKGFDENLCCRGFQYEVGKEYEQEGEIVCGRTGFHACTNPFDVLDYYCDNSKDRFCVVEQSGIIKLSGQDTKRSSSKIKIISEIGIAGLFKAGIEWIKEKTNPDTIIKSIKDEGNIESGDRAKIVSSSDYAQMFSSGNFAQIGSIGNSAQIGSIGTTAQIGSSGKYAQIGSSGKYAHIGSSGDYAHIGSSGYSDQICSSGQNAQIVSIGYSAQICSSGDYAKIGSSGDFAQIGSSGNYAKIGSIGSSAQIGSSGDCAKIVSIGYSAKIGSSGNYAKIASTGEDSVICCAGKNSMVRAKKGSWITLSEWKYSEENDHFIPVCVKTEFVDGARIKEDTWYKLVDGEFKEQ